MYSQKQPSDYRVGSARPIAVGVGFFVGLAEADGEGEGEGDGEEEGEADGEEEGEADGEGEGEGEGEGVGFSMTSNVPSPREPA
ncbi:MAG: hypothetical protein ACXV5F_01450 [Halobacteriota archaeon]